MQEHTSRSRHAALHLTLRPTARSLATCAAFTATGLALILLSTACAPGGDAFWAEFDQPEDDEVVPVDISNNAYAVAHDYIIDTRPRGTGVLLNQLSEVVADNDLINVDDNVEDPLAPQLPTGVERDVCPPSSAAFEAPGLDCRGVSHLAAGYADHASGPLKSTVTQDINARYAQSLNGDEVSFVNGWAHESIRSGVRSGAVRAVSPLRNMGVCDTDLNPTQVSFRQGEVAGSELIMKIDEEMRDDIPPSLCNSDVYALSVLSAARRQSETESSPCAYTPTEDIFSYSQNVQKVDAWKDGRNAGMLDAYEVLRVQLVGELECERPEYDPGDDLGDLDACKCYARHSGSGPVYCFPKREFPQGVVSGTELANRADSGVPQCTPKDNAAPKPVGSPLVFDLDGDGVTLDGSDEFTFDLAGTGEPARIDGLVGEDALLALDLDGDGEITTGAELFGNHTACGDQQCADGLEAIAQHDANGDGRLDANDPAFARLRLWRDADGDGQSQPGELTALIDREVVAVDLAPRTDLAWVDDAGNSTLRGLTFHRADGTTGDVHDVWFALEFDQMPTNPKTTGIITSQIRPSQAALELLGR